MRAPRAARSRCSSARRRPACGSSASPTGRRRTRERAFREAGIEAWLTAPSSPRGAEASIARGVPVLTDDPRRADALSDAIDIIVEVTGTVDFAASVALDAFEHGKHVVLVNAELDSLLGPILKAKADARASC